MSISSVNSSSSAMASGAMRSMQRPDPAKMAEDLFSKLDTKGQGYIEKSDLESALGKTSQSANSSSSSIADEMFAKLDGNGDGKVTKEEMSATIQKIAAELDGPAPRARMQGGMPPPPPPQGGTQGASSTDNSQSSDLDPADTNGDGTVSTTEAQAYQALQAEKNLSATDASASSADAQLMQMLTGQMPPPPPQGGSENDPGFSKDQLSSMSKELNSTDSERAKLISDIADNFDTADVNGDGKVSGSEAKAYEQSKNSSDSNTDSASSTSSTDAQFMKHMLQLLKSYGGLDQATEKSSFSTSA